MKFAILFWFYKEIDVCENRLRLLKEHNPELKIYGLFGGEQKDAELYKNKLSSYLDDFYVSPSDDSDWKWIHGDLMILEWFEKRGVELEWDSIAIVQWDMLIFDSIAKQFSNLKKDEIYLSGLRVLDKGTENRWSWTKPGSEKRNNFLKFVEYIETNYQFQGELLCCLFIFEIFPRLFFTKYLTVQNREIGMLEYKIPNYAKIFNIPFYKKDLGVFWSDGARTIEESPLNAWPTEIQKEFIDSELSKPDGYRIFHPYFKNYFTQNNHESSNPSS